MKTVIVIGAGPSGIIAAATASQKGNNVILLEKNKFIGKKMLITGNGRCNITNACDIQGLIENTISNSNFLYSAYYSFSNIDIINILRKYGVEVKVEENNRFFPLTDKSTDVVNALYNYLLDNDLNLNLNSEVKEISKQKNKFIVKYNKSKEIKTASSDSVIIATGGKSYPSTGSTGDGYSFANNLGHKVTNLIPSIVPINLKEEWIDEIKGLSLFDVKVKLKHKNKLIDSQNGDIIFTHFGISGPAILNLTSRKNNFIANNKFIKLYLDLFYNYNSSELDNIILKLLNENPNKNILNILNSMVKNKLLLNILKNNNISIDKKANKLKKEERKIIINSLKNLEFNILGLRPIEEAYVTSGGVDTKEINPKTMESKIVKNLYFCGEILDVDAYTGGFNLQIGYSTGYLAGSNC